MPGPRSPLRASNLARHTRDIAIGYDDAAALAGMRFLSDFPSELRGVTQTRPTLMNPESVTAPVSVNIIPWRRYLAISLLILTLAVVVRAVGISTRSLWYDEAIAANISRGSMSETIILTRLEHSAPILHPLILFAVERVAQTPLAVRVPSLVASILAIFALLGFTTLRSVGWKSAVIAALMMAVAASQVRYAQEVREYSLSVLFAVALVYVYLSFSESQHEKPSSKWMCAMLFLAPCVQYGLVLLGAGTLAALWILSLANKENKNWYRYKSLLLASIFFGCGCVLSYLLTLRYQWGGRPWYLQGSYFKPGSSSFLEFALWNSDRLVEYLLPGRAIVLICLLSSFVYLRGLIRSRKCSAILLLTVTCFGTVLFCARFRLYPYDGVRQCLFLAPVLYLFVSETLAFSVNQIESSPWRNAAMVVFCLGIGVCGLRQIRSFRPYDEIEDVPAMLAVLHQQVKADDYVYVYSGAVPAVDFYLQKRNERFIYGDFHREDPGDYTSEALRQLPPDVNRFWILFSHIYRDEDAGILRSFRPDWSEHFVASSTGSSLYLLSRETSWPYPAVGSVSQAEVSTARMTTVKGTEPDPKSFLGWNLRNSRLTN